MKMDFEMEPFTATHFMMDNIDFALNDLSKKINFKTKPTLNSQLHVINGSYNGDWLYVLHDGQSNELCKGALSDSEFEVFLEEFMLQSAMETKEERELNIVLDRLTNIIQEDYTVRIKAESAIHELVQEGEIEARTGDRILSMLDSRNEY